MKKRIRVILVSLLAAMLAGTNVFAGTGRTSGDNNKTQYDVYPETNLRFVEKKDIIYLASGSDAVATTENTEKPTERPTESPSIEKPTAENGSGVTTENTTENTTEKSEENTTEGNKQQIISSPSYSYTNADIQQLKKEYSNTKSEKEKVSKELKELMSQQNDFITVLQKMDEKIMEYEDKKKDLQDKKKRAEETVAVINKELEQAEEEENAQYAILKAHIQNAYENQNFTYLDALLNAADFGDVLNNAEYIQAVDDYDKKLLADFTEKRRTIANKKVLLESIVDDSGLLEQALNDEEEILIELSDAKDKQIADYQAAIDSGKSKLESLEQLEFNQTSKLSNIEKTSHTIVVYEQGAYNGEKFAWPCPSSTYITSYFGGRDAPIAGASTYHMGIDIGADMGDHAVAAMSGTVIHTGYIEAMGNTIMIDIGSGYTIVYEHLSGYACSPGDKVVRGQVVGYVGSTGISTGAHLHFGVRHNGEYVDPLDYLLEKGQ